MEAADTLGQNARLLLIAEQYPCSRSGESSLIDKVWSQMESVGQLIKKLHKVYQLFFSWRR
jgi:hypothetical protein